MPCYEAGSGYGYSTTHTVEPLRKDLAKMEAYLCAVMKVLEKNEVVMPVMEQIDAKEAGVYPDEIYGWWLQHRRKDAKRKEQEEKR